MDTEGSPPHPVFDNFVLVLLLSSVTFGAFWFVYHGIMTRRVAKRHGAAFWTPLVWLALALHVASSVTMMLAAEGATRLASLAEGLNAGAGALMALVLFVALRGMPVDGIAQWLPAAVAVPVAMYPLVFMNWPSGVEFVVGAISWAAFVFLVVAWYALHRQMSASAPTPEAVPATAEPGQL